jgi:hypothetical protein
VQPIVRRFLDLEGHMRNLAYEFRYPAFVFIFHPLNPERIGLVVGGAYLEVLDVDHALNCILCWNADMVIPVSDIHSQSSSK